MRWPGISRFAKLGVVVSLSLVLSTCVDSPVGSRVTLGLSVVMPDLSALAGNIDIDRLRIVVTGSGNRPVADTSLAFGPETSLLQVEIPFQLTGSSETVQVTVTLQGGAVDLFSGTQTQVVPSDQLPPPITFTYVGPGNQLTRLLVEPRDSLLTTGGELQFRVSAFAGGQPVPTFYVSWSIDNQTLAEMNGVGRLRAAQSRGTVLVRVRSPNGVRDSTRIAITPPLSALEKISGDNQSGTAGTALAQPLVVRVVATDQVGASGVSVNFAPPAGGEVGSPVAVTNAQGLAQTTAILPSTLGDFQFTASVTGLQSVQFSATSNALPVTQLAFLQQPTDGTAGTAIAPAVRVAAQNASGTTVTSYQTPMAISIGNNPTNANVTGGGPVTPINGVATFPNLTLDRGGVGYTLVVTSGSLQRTSQAFTLIGAVSPSLSTVAASPTSLRAGLRTSTITVTVRDQQGSPLAGIPVTLAATGTDNTLVQPAGPTDANGVAIGTLFSGFPETKAVSAVAGGVALVQSPRVTFVPGIVFAGSAVGNFVRGAFAVNPNGTDRVTLFFDGVNSVGSPRTASNRRRITFTFPSPQGIPGVAIGTAAGDSVVPVVNDALAERPRFNPNGTRLAFGCGSSFSADDVCVIPNVSGAMATLAGIGNGAGKVNISARVGSGPGTFVWDPLNPDRLAFVRRDQSSGASRIFTANFDGSGVAALSGPLILGNDTLTVGTMDWAPDGSYLALSAITSSGFQHLLYTIDRNGNNLTQFTTAAPVCCVEDTGPVISPDGKSILFLRSDLAFEGNILDYFVVNLSRVIRQVSAENMFFASISEMTYDWSPDGTQIVLTGSNGSALGVYVLPAGTTATSYLAARRLVSQGNRDEFSPSWRP
jgi:hypothetical protein